MTGSLALVVVAQLREIVRDWSNGLVGSGEAIARVGRTIEAADTFNKRHPPTPLPAMIDAADQRLKPRIIRSRMPGADRDAADMVELDCGHSVSIQPADKRTLRMRCPQCIDELINERRK